MSKRSLNTAVFLAFLITLALTPLETQAQGASSSGKRIEVATVSISRIVDSYERTSDLNASLKEKETELRADEEKIVAKLKTAVEGYNAFKAKVKAMQEKGTLPEDPAARKALQEEEMNLRLPLRQQELLLARKRQQIDMELVQAKRNSQILIVRDILNYIRAKIALTDYDIVINMDEDLTSDTRIDGGFMFARHRTDITDMIIRGLNKQFRALPK